MKIIFMALLVNWNFIIIELLKIKLNKLKLANKNREKSNLTVLIAQCLFEIINAFNAASKAFNCPVKQ